MDKAGREKRNQEILESYNLGNSYFKMAETFGLSKGGVHKIIQAIKNEKPIIPQPKQETIEEVAERILANNIDGLKDLLNDDDLFYFYKGVIINYGVAVAEHQSEKTFSEEDMRNSFCNGYRANVKSSLNDSFQDWLNKFKK